MGIVIEMFMNYSGKVVLANLYTKKAALPLWYCRFFRYSTYKSSIKKGGLYFQWFGAFLQLAKFRFFTQFAVKLQCVD